jgi:hypothetical protein
MTLIAAAPNTPAEPTVEAINAIMDIYADADFDYDGPVFVNCGFLAHLQKALPNVRTMVSNRLIFCFLLICRIPNHPLFSRFWFRFNFCCMRDFPEYLAAGSALVKPSGTEAFIHLNWLAILEPGSMGPCQGYYWDHDPSALAGSLTHLEGPLVHSTP